MKVLIKNILEYYTYKDIFFIKLGFINFHTGKLFPEGQSESAEFIQRMTLKDYKIKYARGYDFKISNASCFQIVQVFILFNKRIYEITISYRFFCKLCGMFILLYDYWKRY